MTSKRRLKKSRTRLGLVFLTAVAALLLGGRLWQTARMSVWKGNFDFSWINQQGEALTVYTLMPEYGRQVTWILPGQMMVETAFGAGPYQWRKVFALGELDKQGGAGLMRTSQEVLGLAIKGWRVEGKTNMSWWDRLKWWYFSTFKVKKRLTIDLNQEPNWQIGTLINEQIFSQKIADESLSVRVVNGNGLSRVLTNQGLEVVSVDRRPEIAEKTVIWLKDPAKEDNRTVAWLQWLLPGSQVKVSDQKDQWTDLVLEVGKDYN